MKRQSGSTIITRYTHHLLWLSNQRAADRTAVLCTMGGLRGHIKEWTRASLQGKTGPTTRASAVKQKAQAAQPESESYIAKHNVKLEKAIARHKFANVDRVIFPIHEEYVYLSIRATWLSE